MADYLIERGGTLSENTLNNYIEAEGYACIKELIEQLEEQNTELSVPEDQFYAMTDDNEKLLEYLSDNEPSDEEILIKYAAANCNVEVLKLLKPYSSNFNYVDENGQTLLHIAAKFNTPEVVKYFIEQGADLHAETEFYMWNALSMAVLGEKAENVQLLLDEGMTWQCEGPLGGDTWIAACMAGSGASIEMLLEYGFDPTPEEMVYGYENCNDNTFKTLLKNNISYTEEYDDYSGVDALVAIHPQYAKEVFENDPDIEITPEIIEYAITSGNDAFAVKVIDLAKDLNVCFTMTPLETAVVSGNMELVEYLIQRGADINSQIEEAGSHTVMHTAAENLSTDILKYLLEQGGDTQAIDSEGLLPEDRAEMAGLDENYELLAQ